MRKTSDFQLIIKGFRIICCRVDRSINVLILRRSSSFSYTNVYLDIHSGKYLYRDNFRAAIAVWLNVAQISRYSVRTTCLPGSKVQDP